MNLLESMDLQFPNILLIIVNIVLIIFAVFLLVRVRKSIGRPEEVFEHDAYLIKEQETDLTGIANIKPEEFNPERFDLNKDFFTPSKIPKKTHLGLAISAMQASATLSFNAVDNDAGILETDELEIKDELPEEFGLFQDDNLEIPQPVKQEKTAEEAFVVSPEPEITLPEKEEEEIAEEEIAEEEIAEEETIEEELEVLPGLELFSLEATIKHEENTELKPVEKLTSSPELKLFTLVEIPATLTDGLSGGTSIPEQKAKKVSKRKSLF